MCLFGLVVLVHMLAFVVVGVRVLAVNMPVLSVGVALGRLRRLVTIECFRFRGIGRMCVFAVRMTVIGAFRRRVRVVGIAVVRVAMIGLPGTAGGE
jgi:hypothetical protein